MMMQGAVGSGDVVSVALLIQAGAVIFWGGKIQQIMKDHDRRISKTEERVEGNDADHTELRTRIENLERGE
jgi:hypothetical protein